MGEDSIKWYTYSIVLTVEHLIMAEFIPESIQVATNACEDVQGDSFESA
jgi:hypothetical protein